MPYQGGRNSEGYQRPKEMGSGVTSAYYNEKDPFAAATAPVAHGFIEAYLEVTQHA